jgi:hypothetical protein
MVMYMVMFMTSYILDALDFYLLFPSRADSVLEFGDAYHFHTTTLLR